VLDAITGAGDPNQAQLAATQAHQRQHDAWAIVLGGVVAAAALAAGRHIVHAAQAAGVDVPAYDPQSDDPDSPDAWATGNQASMATGVQHHTGRMLAAALAGAVLGGAGGAAIGVTVTGLYDQWTGQTDSGDYAGQLAGDLTVLGWGMGELFGIGQVTADGQWSAEKTWNTMGDDRVRATHDDVDGVTIDASDSFDVGGEDLDYPGDPAGSDAEVAGCRCWLTWAMVNNLTGESQDIGAMDE
jgi:hypothetical protein